MDIVVQILGNKCIYLPLCTWFFIQPFKFITDFVKNKKINFRRLLGAGGMPSSHSAVVCCLAITVGKTIGFNSPEFAIGTILAFIVMYDAAGVRRAAGKQARLLNKIIETPGLSSIQVQERLVEVLGHTPVQVFVGAVIGILVGAVL